MRDYDEIGGFRIKVPSNMPTKILYVAFTPDAQPQAVRNAFDVRLDCIWNVTGCLTTRQVLPALWNEKVSRQRDAGKIAGALRSQPVEDDTKEVYPILMRTMTYQISRKEASVFEFSRTAEEKSDWVFLSMRQHRRERGLAEAGRRIIRLQEVHFDFSRHQ
jgi:hypothetical protein